MHDAISLHRQATNSATKSTQRLVVLGLGTNLGNRLALLTSAGEQIAALGVAQGAASLWESDAVGPPQDRYWNTALALLSELSAGDLVGAILAIEKRLGRDRKSGERWGPRTIDIDLLWIDGEHSAAAHALVPHPRLHERSFALTPLLEVAPFAVDPRTGQAFLPAPDPPLTRIGFGYTTPIRWGLSR